MTDQEVERIEAAYCEAFGKGEGGTERLTAAVLPLSVETGWQGCRSYSTGKGLCLSRGSRDQLPPAGPFLTRAPVEMYGWHTWSEAPGSLHRSLTPG